MTAGSTVRAARLHSIFINRNFAQLWGAFGATNLADGIMLAVGPLLAVSLTREPFLIAATVFVSQVPWLIFGLFSGVVVDRLERRKIIMVVNLCRALVLGLLGVSLFLDVASIYLLYLAVFLLGTAETLADNASTALVAQLVPADQLGTANSRIIGTMTFANQLAGPPLGALLFAVAAALPVTLNAVCLCLAALLISRVRADRPPRGSDDGGHEPVALAIRAGISFLVRHSGLRTLSIAILMMNVTFMCAFSVWVLYVRDQLGLSALGFGLLMSTMAVGGIIGSIAFPRLERRFGSATLLRVGLVTETLTHLSLALSQHWVQAGITMLIFGCHATIWGSVALTARQRATPSALMGRVNSVYLVFSVGGAALGALLGGAIAQSFSVLTTFWVAYFGMVVTTVAVWRSVVNVTAEGD